MCVRSTTALFVRGVGGGEKRLPTDEGVAISGRIVENMYGTVSGKAVGYVCSEAPTGPLTDRSTCHALKGG